ncbi:hypothetical protein A2304_02220 [Candidatus Uhrbacteria bacterium RIFOXYB2_FULL_57_15]|uniref:Thioredoxin domain-containing protein n=1 Tax=Candidatus Uhrbacteria bacterium RIFOXYB2_FULL_57_15 TaxID=1802422 RepID=A0A1F7W6N2_9BACT|nr:MAG: hypothetical protein A2304_02220 [Candidatus Uhrbacteria bacterium RIFOXYB2_FULL_57_15]OGL99200.1 MAG: hypothetical protein A2501_03315 [Candidatus Uhrbacteria bacterium RIFOXYC12_FULL_57_11]
MIMALLEFYGAECPHCVTMMSMIDKLIAEGILIERFETWHNDENAEKLKEYDRGLCGGVPFFYNTESKRFICGETDEETLRKWARGENV